MDPRTSLAVWLRTGRAERNMSLDDVARVTKIQTRILERLEAGKHEGLPAEVFVRGFVRSVARCLGLDEDEALERWGACAQLAPPPVATPIGPAARGVVEAMSDLAPNAARSPRILRTGEMPVYVPPSDEPAETMLLPMTGTLVMEKLEVAPAGSLEIPIPAVEADAVPVEAPAVSGRPEDRSPDRDAPGSVDGGRRCASSVADATEVVETPVETPVAEQQPVAETAPAVSPENGSKKKRKSSGKGRGKRKSLATGTPSEPAPVIAAPPADIALEAPIAPPVEVAPPAEVAAESPPVEIPLDAASDSVTASATDSASASASTSDSESAAASATDSVTAADAESVAATGPASATPDSAPAVSAVDVADAAPPADEDPFIAAAIEAAEARSVAEATTDVGWTPKMPPLATTSQPWRISRPQQSALPLTPSLVIDDADPESAAREVEERETSQDPAPRRSFLPPILLDREDRSARQGGLTLAVIILLIAATLTLSYLMRRPSSSGDGVTQDEVPASLIG